MKKAILSRLEKIEFTWIGLIELVFKSIYVVLGIACAVYLFVEMKPVIDKLVDSLFYLLFN